MYACAHILLLRLFSPSETTLAVKKDQERKIKGETMLKKWISKIVYEVLRERINDLVTELDTDKNYIVVLPGNISKGNLNDTANAFSVFDNKVNLVVLASDNVKIVEIG